MTAPQSINEGESLRKGRILKSYCYALWLSLVVAGLIVVAEKVAAPIHAAGRGQTLLGYFLGTAHLLNLPGFTTAELAGRLSCHEWSWGALAQAAGVSGTFW